MAVIVNSGPASIHADFVIVERMELFHLAGERVVKIKGHSESRKAEKNSHSRGMKEWGSNGAARGGRSGKVVNSPQTLSYEQHVMHCGNNREGERRAQK